MCMDKERCIRTKYNLRKEKTSYLTILIGSVALRDFTLRTVFLGPADVDALSKVSVLKSLRFFISTVHNGTRV